MSCWKASKDFFALTGGRCDRSTLNAPFQPIRLALEIHQAFHVVGVVDARIGRIFADEGIGGVDRRIDLVILVVGVDQVQLRLASGFAERETRLQRFELLDRLGIAGTSDGLLRLGVDLLRARIWRRRRGGCGSPWPASPRRRR